MWRNQTLVSILWIIGAVVLGWVSAPLVSRIVTPLYANTIVTFFYTNSSLRDEVLALQSEVQSHNADKAMIAVLQNENKQLKAELGRNDIQERKAILARIVTVPSRSIYDTFIIDAGTNNGIAVGQQVLVFGGVAIGVVSTVSERTATVLLYSAAGQQLSAVVGDDMVTVTLIGRGAGEYEVHMPRSVPFAVGDAISTQSIDTKIIATIEKIETDPRDPFQRLLAKAPVSFASLQWVTVQ